MRICACLLKIIYQKNGFGEFQALICLEQLPVIRSSLTFVIDIPFLSFVGPFRPRLLEKLDDSPDQKKKKKKISRPFLQPYTSIPGQISGSI